MSRLFISTVIAWTGFCFGTLFIHTLLCQRKHNSPVLRNHIGIHSRALFKYITGISIDSAGLYLENQTSAHKSHLCKYLTSAQCVFYVFFMSVERPHLEWHSLPALLRGGGRNPKSLYRLIFEHMLIFHSERVCVKKYNMFPVISNHLLLCFNQALLFSRARVVI